ncbi:MAG: DUF4368 domain-containing protein [bacterium]|nr:DUF4368 domain-containing protein [bacterium]
MVSGRLSEARFQMLSDDYDQEQADLRAKIDQLSREIAEQEDQAENVERFIQQVKKYLYIDKLTPTILNDMVNAVYVHTPDKSSGHRVQEIEISYNYIGILPANLMQNVQNAKTAWPKPCHMKNHLILSYRNAPQRARFCLRRV